MLVLYSKITSPEHADAILSLLPQLPLAYKERLDGLICWQDVQASLIGRSLLIRGMKLFNQDIDLNRIRYSQYGKPYIESSSIKFNISHSGDYVVCAIVQDGEIGIDIGNT